MNPTAIVVRPRRVNEEAMRMEFCDADVADFFSVFVEDDKGQLHFPEEIGLEGISWDFNNAAEAACVASWVSTGLIHIGGKQ